MKKRIFYLDFLRGFAIVMVLILHSISDYITDPTLYGSGTWYVNLFLNAIARTGVPLFFMISGGLLLSSERTADLGKFYRKNLLHIVLPLVFWDAAYFVWRWFRGYIVMDWKLFLADFLNCGTEYHLWYLYTLIGIYLLAPYLKILADRCSVGRLWWLLCLMLLCSSIRPFINLVTPCYIYLFEPIFNGYIACFFLGYLLFVTEIGKKALAGLIVAGVFGLSGSMILNHLHSSREGIDLVLNYGYSLCHYALAASIFGIAKYALKKRAVLRRTVSALSKYSFGIYLIHIAVMDVVTKDFMHGGTPLAASGYIFVVTLAISFAVTFLLYRIPYLRKIVS